MVTQAFFQLGVDLNVELVYEDPEAADFIEDENEQNDDEENEEIPNEQPTSAYGLGNSYGLYNHAATYPYAGLAGLNAHGLL
ncbi:unnamed protein product [Brachionus calyciflorus]|uniref:Uncharacterized protein n=1 Tax=Brachionus calyciflorus TaxID=104777 RepID=A0A814I769_9BILA|nr:unnamed protein product [Brachionus calyciflorus]